MNIAALLSPDDTIERQPADKQHLLAELATLAATKLAAPAERIAAALSKRESLGSTGMGNGVAIPHARFSELRKPFGIFARLGRPIDFDAIDGAPVDLVFVLLLPERSEGASLSALAAVARKLRSPDTLVRLRASKDVRELHQALLEDAPTELSVRS
jgi:PTS system nitrogen regulatory IIA component